MRRVRVRRHIRDNPKRYGKHVVQEHERRNDGGLKACFMRIGRAGREKKHEITESELEFLRNHRDSSYYSELNDEDREIVDKLQEKGLVEISEVQGQRYKVHPKVRMSRSYTESTHRSVD